MKHIVIIKGKKVELTTEEARAVFEELEKVFGRTAVPVIIERERLIPQPYPVPVLPTYFPPTYIAPPSPFEPPYVVTC